MVIAENAVDQSGTYLNYVRNPNNGYRTVPLPGEARTIQAVRKILIAEHGWYRRDIRTKPFRTPGRTGME